MVGPQLPFIIDDELFVRKGYVESSHSQNIADVFYLRRPCEELRVDSDGDVLVELNLLVLEVSEVVEAWVYHF